ncbi:MAG: flavodoxin family protein [Planctomycetota bacterium]
MSEQITRRGFLGATGAAGGMMLGGAGEARGGQNGDRSRIIAINCSRRAGMNTALALNISLEAARAVAPETIETELIELAGKELHAEVAAGVELPQGAVDDFLPIAEKLGDPKVKGIIVGTPVYFSAMSSPCKDFIERLGVFRKQEYALGDVVAGVLAIGGARNGGQEMAITSVQATLFCQEMIVVGAGRNTSRFGACIWGGAEGGVEEATNRAAAEDLGRRVAKVALALAGS